jgi:hypothetical protein
MRAVAVLDRELGLFVRGSLHGDESINESLALGGSISSATGQRVSGVNRMKYGLLWLIGVPIPILIIALLIFR